jgi:hypothetical protein
MKSTRFERITRTRSFLISLDSGINTPKHDKEKIKTFAADVLALLPEPLDLNKVVALRRYTHSAQEVPRLLDLHTMWDPMLLARMQMASKPVANMNFCLQALALAMDLGTDLHGPRLQAILLSLHHRVGAESKLRILGSDIVVLIANMSLLE